MATSGESMLDLLTRYAEPKVKGCTVSAWLSTLNKEEQAAFQKIKDNNATVQLANLYNDIISATELPFKLTAFRSHFRGYCICRK
jgi:CII-binding regulator of phage lambda lysogenization HflD